MFYVLTQCFSVIFLKSLSPFSNRPPLPPHVTNHHQQHWGNGNAPRQTDNFANTLPPRPMSLVIPSASPPLPSQFSISPQHGVNQSQNPAFINQTQVGGMTPIRRPVPLPGTLQSTRNMSASAFNLNQNAGATAAYPGNLQPQSNQWGFPPMNQVRVVEKVTHSYMIEFYLFPFLCRFIQAQSMAQLNMMQNPWQHHQQQWGNFNGSNMSLNLPPHHFMPPDAMWNPWMQQPYPYPYPMPNGSLISLCTMKITINSIDFSSYRNAITFEGSIKKSFTCRIASAQRTFTSLNDELETETTEIYAAHRLD